MKPLKRKELQQEPSTMPETAQGEEHNNIATDTPVADSDKHITLVRTLVERCLKLYMNMDEAVKTLHNRSEIDPEITFIVWKGMEQDNAEFFRAYYARLNLKKQILLFSSVLERQHRLMMYPEPELPNFPLPSLQNGIQPMHVLQPASFPRSRNCHFDYMNDMPSSYHMVNGIPTPDNFYPDRMNSWSNMEMDSISAYIEPTIPPSSGMPFMSEMVMGPPASVAPNGQLPITRSDTSEMNMGVSVFDTAFTSNVTIPVEMQLGSDYGGINGSDSFRHFAHNPLNFRTPVLPADLSNFPEALGNYPPPYFPFTSDFMLDSLTLEDIGTENYLDVVPERSSRPVAENGRRQ